MMNPQTDVSGGPATAEAAGPRSGPTEPADRPPVPESLEETGLSAAFVSDLLVRSLYGQGARTGDQLANLIRLPFPILDDELLTLQQRRLVEVRGTQGHGRRGYTFDLTGEGRGRARELMHTSRYVGPAPVPLDQYRRWVGAHRVQDAQVRREDVRRGFSHLVLDEGFMDVLGPGINSGKSLFLYGHAGNGKTTIAEAIARLLGGAIHIPFAVESEGQIITIFDPVAHRPVEESPDDDTPAWLRPPPAYDSRFVEIERPVVMVGGELTLDDLELQFDAQAGAFRAPPQVRANGGVFIIDDFGRQRVRPRDLLNRWMVPLEKHEDYLGLPMGHKMPVPFECLLIFATNLDPTELVEEAFLRRIRYKVLVDNPTAEQYAEIFRRCCEAQGLAYDPEAVRLIYEEYYQGRGIPPRACHPRDIVNHLVDLGRYLEIRPSLSREMVRQACRSYFLEVSAGQGEEATGAHGAPVPRAAPADPYGRFRGPEHLRGGYDG